MQYSILDNDMNKVLELDNFISIIWTEKAKEAGTFELKMNPDSNLLSMIKLGYYLMSSAFYNIKYDNGIKIKDEANLMIIETMTITNDPEEGDTLIITGSSLLSILKRRVLWKQMNYIKYWKEVEDDQSKIVEYRTLSSRVYREDDYKYVSPVTALDVIYDLLYQNIVNPEDVIYNQDNAWVNGNWVDFQTLIKGSDRKISNFRFEHIETYSEYSIDVNDNPQNYDLYELFGSNMYFRTKDTTVDPNKKYYTRSFPSKYKIPYLKDEKTLDTDSLYDIITNIGSDYKLSMEIVYDFINDEFVFRFLGVEQHSYGKSSNPVVFSAAFDNIRSSNYIKSDSEYANVSLIFGSGDEYNRTCAVLYDGVEVVNKYVEVNIDEYVNPSPKNNGWYEKDTSTTYVLSNDEITVSGKTYYLKMVDDNICFDNIPKGIERRENVIDESSVNFNDLSGISDQSGVYPYRNYIREKALTEWNKKYKHLEMFEGEIDLTDNTYVYGIDYKIGDICDVSNKYDIESMVQVSEVSISESASGGIENSTVFEKYEEDDDIDYIEYKSNVKDGD